MADDKTKEPSIEQRIKQVVIDELGCDDSEVTPNAHFMDDLGADSLDQVEMIMRIEEEFEIEIPDEDAEKIQKVGDAVRYVENKLNKP